MTAAGHDRLGLKVESRITYGEWVQLLRKVYLVFDSSAWWLGDCLAFGEHAYHEKYSVAVRDLGLSHSRVKELTYVSANVPRDRRRAEVSWSHHRLVAPLSSDDQVRWLQAAAAGSWSKRELHEAITRDHVQQRQPRRRAAPASADVEPHQLHDEEPEQEVVVDEVLEEVVVRLVAPAASVERWRVVAAARGVTLDALAAQALDLYDRTSRGRRAADLRSNGHTWAEVAEATGYSSPGNAYNAAAAADRQGTVSAITST
jgi:hypothetical protein